MEGITEIDKTKYIDECKEIVRNEIPEELSDEMLTIVTNEIMDTCLFIGGDFEEANIQKGRLKLNSYPSFAKRYQIR